MKKLLALGFIALLAPAMGCFADVEDSIDEASIGPGPGEAATSCGTKTCSDGCISCEYCSYGGVGRKKMTHCCWDNCGYGCTTYYKDCGTCYTGSGC